MAQTAHHRSAQAIYFAEPRARRFYGLLAPVQSDDLVHEDFLRTWIDAAEKFVSFGVGDVLMTVTGGTDGLHSETPLFLLGEYANALRQFEL